jgi:2'-5' RNA ligase
MTDNAHASEYASAWDRFQALTGLIHTFETADSAWARGRDRYGAFLARIDSEPAREYLRSLSAEIADILGTVTYPEEYWHITIKTAGFLVPSAVAEDELADGRIGEIIDIARMVFAPEGAFSVCLGPVNAFPDVVIAEVWDSGAVRRLNLALLEAIPALFRQPFDGRYFLPHVSLARYDSNDGLDELKGRLQRLRGRGPGPVFEIPAIELISAHLSQSAPSLHTIHRFPLAPPS